MLFIVNYLQMLPEEGIFIALFGGWFGESLNMGSFEAIMLHLHFAFSYT